MKLLGSTKKEFDQDKDQENVPKLQAVKVILVHCNLVNNNYQLASKALFRLIANKQFDQLINASPHSLTMLNTTRTEFSFIDIRFTDQNSKEFEIKEDVNLTLMIG